MEFSFGSNPDLVKKSGGLAATVFLILFSLPFAGFGLFALIQGVKKISSGDSKNGLPLCGFGLVFALVGFGLMAGAILGGKKLRQQNELKTRYADQLWLVRPDWAAGKIKSTTTVPLAILVVFALAFGGGGGAMAFFILPQELHKKNYLALLMLLFPAVGLGFGLALIRQFQAHRRFGDSFFELAQIPAPLGGTLEGQILVGTRLRLEHGLHLKLSCLRRVTTGSGKNSHTEENILWQDEKIFRPEAHLPEPEPGRTGIPVYFKIPADQPEATPDTGDGIHWRLEARAKMSGPSFYAVFEVPVFRVAGAVVAETETDAADPTVALQESVEDLRRDEGSKIQITDGPAGREFYFPAARNLGMAIGVTVFFLVWSGIFYALLHSRAPLLFPIVWGIIDALLGWGCFNLWFKSSRVTIDATGIRAVNRWLLFSRTRNFDAAEVKRLTTKVGMTSGNQAYQDLQIITRAGNNITVAGSIASKPEADWLVQEMSKALGRRA